MRVDEYRSRDLLLPDVKTPLHPAPFLPARVSGSFG